MSTSAASAYAIAASRKGPASAGMPTCSLSRPVGWTRFGPATAPKVVATSTVLLAVPRRSGSARSAPAAGLQVGGSARSVDEQADQQQARTFENGGEGHPGAAQGTGGVAEGEAGPTGRPLGDPTDQQRRSGRAEGEQCGR